MRLMTLPEVSKRTRVPEATLRYWRHEGTYGPRSGKFGRRVMYQEADVERWIAERFDDPTPAG